MKNIDPKSLIIGVLATALVFACTDSNKKNSASPSLVTEAKAATGVNDKWDDGQEWIFAKRSELLSLGLVTSFKLGTDKKGSGIYGYKITGGWDLFSNNGSTYNHLFRKRIK
jgi:hypothetical protein